MQHLFLILTILLTGINAYAQTELKFRSFESVIEYAEKNNAAIKSGEQQAILANWQKVAAIANTVNFRNLASFTLTDNTQLPVNFIPASVFGGTEGTFREIQFGQQYIGNAAIVPQIDIINPAAWERIRTANVNRDLTEINNLLNKKYIYESIAVAYYNILSLHEQIYFTEENLLKSDTLLIIVKNKNAQGIIRQQDVNDASAGKLSLQDKLTQLMLTLHQNHLILKILCDIPESSNILIEEKLNTNMDFPAEVTATSLLHSRASELQTGLTKSDLRFNRLSQLPALSLFLNYAWQQNSNKKFFDSQSKWIDSRYVGVRLSFNIPDVNKMILTKNSKINYLIALNNFEHAKIQNEVANRQLQLDYQKAYSQFNSNKIIFELKDENYKMAVNQYQQSIIPFEKLLLTFTEQLNSRYNYINSAVNLFYYKTKIDLNNKIK